MTDVRLRAPDLAGAALVAGVAVWLFSCWEPALTGADAPGYFVPGRMLATDATSVLVPASPTQFIGAHWLDAGDGRFVGRYPPGLPFLVAALYRLGGPEVALSLNPLLATLATVLFLLVARRWVSPWLAVAGTAVFAALAPFAEQALLGFSHMATTTALLGALLFFDRWHEKPGAIDGIVAGFFIGAIPAIRYPEALFTLVLGVAALVSSRSPGHRRALPYVALGAAIPLGAVLLRNRQLFGSLFATGYGLTMEQSAFGVGYFVTHFVGYVGTLARNGGLAVALGAAGIVLMIARPATRARGLLLAALVGPITVLYMAFFWPFADVRFLLPTLPLYVLGAVWLVDRLEPVRTRRLALGLLLLFQGVLLVADGVPRTRRVARFADRTQTVRSAVLATVPAGSVVVAPPAFEALLEYDGRWKLAEWRLLWQGPLPPLPTGVPEPVAKDGRRQASPQQPGKGDALRRKYLALGEPARTQAVLDDAREWAGGAGTFWIGSDEWTGAVAALVGPRIRFERVHRVADTAIGGARVAEQSWWLPALPVNIYRVHFDAGA